jgi:chromosome segregation ATPase
MLTASKLEKIIELEDNLKAQYQEQLDAKAAALESANAAKEELQASIDKQLEQIKVLSTEASANKKIQQQNRELHQRCENLQADMAAQKQRMKTLQKDLAAEREETKSLKQFDPAKMKKNLAANKKKLAEKTAAADALQKSLSKSKTENAELQNKVAELEAKLAELDVTENEEATAEA